MGENEELKATVCKGLFTFAKMPAKILGKAPVEKPAKNRNNIKGALALTGFGDATLIENKHNCKNSHCCYCACFYFKNLSV